MILPDDTIGALSTPPGKGGVAVIRISGRNAFSAADVLFSGRVRPSRAMTNTIHYGKCVIPDTGEILDEVMLVTMRAPGTYTREDVIEIHTHGNMSIVRALLAEIYKCGVRPAEPGEFTMRAYLNGRLDLTQAEAVADLIESQTAESRRAAMNQLSGGLEEKIRDIRRKTIEIFALYEAGIDFYEEDVELIDREKATRILNEITADIDELIDSYKIGRVLREGAAIGLFGRVNAGKSSLFNALLGRDRAIVHTEPGTTRDLLEGTTEIDGIVCRLIDTAGFREETSYVEAEGIRRSAGAMEEIDIALLVIDANNRNPEEERKIFASLYERMGTENRIIVVYNKVDLLNGDSAGNDNGFQRVKIISVSALTGWGINELRKDISGFLYEKGAAYTSGIIVTNSRHQHLLSETLRILKKIKESVGVGISGEFLALDFKEAIDCLGRITGETLGDDILHQIFAKFCIGK